MRRYTLSLKAPLITKIFLLKKYLHSYADPLLLLLVQYM